MASTALGVTLPKEYGYVVLTAAGSCFLSVYHGLVTGRARRDAKTPYPNAYCTREEINSDKDKYIFNCAQRAHANFLEHYPMFLIGLFGSGIRYPLIASAMGTSWTVFRFFYLQGYTRKDKVKGEGRSAGFAYYLPETGLILLSLWTGIEMLIR